MADATCIDSRRQELQRRLDWASDHASSLAQLLNSYEDGLEDLRRAIETCSTGVQSAENPVTNQDSCQSRETDAINSIQQDVCGIDKVIQIRDTKSKTFQSPHNEYSSVRRDELLRQELDGLGETRITIGHRLGQACDIGEWTLMVTVCESRIFQWIVAATIVGSVMFMAYEVDDEIERLREPSEDIHKQLKHNVNLGIIILFSLEMLLKMLAYRTRFFFGRDWRWNAFDAYNVLAATLDYILSQTGSHSVASILRPARSLKLLRMVSVIRSLSQIRELRLLAMSLRAAGLSLFWTLSLVFMITFLFACAFTQAWAGHIYDKRGLVSSEVYHFWGSTSRAMLSLYMASTGGDDWHRIIHPLIELGAPFYWLFLAYITFFLFVVSNIITSLMVDTALQNSDKDDGLIAMQHFRKKNEYVRYVKTIFASLETPEHHGHVELEDFRAHIHDTNMIAFAEHLDVDPADLEDLFITLSNHGQRVVDIDSFVLGCIRMRGFAKSVDMVETLSLLQHAERKHDLFEHRCLQGLEQLAADIKNDLHHHHRRIRHQSDRMLSGSFLASGDAEQDPLGIDKGPAPVADLNLNHGLTTFGL